MRKKANVLFGPLLLWVALTACSSQTAAPAEADRDKKFQEMMTGVTLAGRSTFFNRDGISDGEEYVIDKVSKLAGDTWLFQIRMKFRDKEIPVPIPIPMQWAGDTPMISMTDVPIPGMGTYTARVLLFRDHYSGAWSGQKGGGGYVFGKIVRNAAE
jgi:hypothetical protein